MKFRLILFVALAALLAVSTAWGQAGVGQLNVTVTGSCGPGGTVTIQDNVFTVTNNTGGFLISINSPSPNAKMCSNDNGTTCTTDANCTFTATCNVSSGKCGGNGPTKGNSCTSNSDCTSVGTCGPLECDDPTIVINDGAGVHNSYTGNSGFSYYGTADGVTRNSSGGLDFCYSVVGCIQGKIGYCHDATNGNPRFHATVPVPGGTPTKAPAFIDIEPCTPVGPSSCANQVGSLCCGLTQGAYGAWNSVATCTGAGCNPIQPTLKGWIPLAQANGQDPFQFDASATNATTIGIPGTKSVSIEDLASLVAYLPASGTPGSFNNLVTNYTKYANTTPIPDANKNSGGSKGQGAGSFAGQTMACSLNSYLSGTLAGKNSGGPFSHLPASATLYCQTAGPWYARVVPAMIRPSTPRTTFARRSLIRLVWAAAL